MGRGADFSGWGQNELSEPAILDFTRLWLLGLCELPAQQTPICEVCSTLSDFKPQSAPFRLQLLSPPSPRGGEACEMPLFKLQRRLIAALPDSKRPCGIRGSRGSDETWLKGGLLNSHVIGEAGLALNGGLGSGEWGFFSNSGAGRWRRNEIRVSNTHVYTHTIQIILWEVSSSPIHCDLLVLSIQNLFIYSA